MLMHKRAPAYIWCYEHMRYVNHIYIQEIYAHIRLSKNTAYSLVPNPTNLQKAGMKKTRVLCCKAWCAVGTYRL